MSEMRLERRIAAPASRVWAIITDLEGAPATLSGVDAVEVLDPGPFDVGTRWRETRTLFGRQVTEEMAVTAVDPGRSYTVESHSRGAVYRWVFDVEPLQDDSCTLSFVFSGQPSGALAKVFAATAGRFFEGPTRRALQKDLDDIAAAAESGAAAPGTGEETPTP